MTGQHNITISYEAYARLRRIEEAARKADEWAMTAGAGTGWGPMTTIHDILRAALADQTADAAIGWDHSDGQTNEEKA